MQLVEMLEPKEGEECQWLGVYVVKWRREWGEPSVMFRETDADPARAIELLSQLYIMCDVAADFSNGVTHQGMDEGRVLAGRFLAQVSAFLKGRDDKHDAYVSDCVAQGEVPF